MPVSTKPPPQLLLHLTFKRTSIHSRVFIFNSYIVGLCRKVRSRRKRQQYDKFIHGFKIKAPLSVTVQSGRTSGKGNGELYVNVLLQTLKCDSQTEQDFGLN